MTARLLANCPTPRAADLEAALETLEQLRTDLRDREHELATVISGVPPAAQPSARNLIHYLSLRAHDLGTVQRVLAAHGLSSLGHAEPHVMANLEAVLHALRALTGRLAPADEESGTDIPYEDGDRLRRERAEALFGPTSGERPVRIMATMPSEAASDFALVRDLVHGGMDCMRINCAHDTPEAWSAMADNLRRARAELGRPCTLLMDLPGPRVRTGEIAPGPRVLKVRPARDELGRVLRPARLWLTAAESPAAPPRPADATLPLPARFLARLAPGQSLRFVDARDARRRIRIVERGEGGAWGVLRKTAYIATGTILSLRIRGDADVAGAVAGLPAIQRKIPLAPGDLLVLTRDPVPGAAAAVGADGAVERPAHVPCTVPEALARVVPGTPVWFDDGRIGGTVEDTGEAGVRVRITHARAGAKLGPGKGVNFPGVDLGLPSLTRDDLRILPHVCRQADLVGYSFARSAEDVRRLREEMAHLAAGDLAIVLKIESTAGFQQLPMMLLEALRCRAAAVMIARGDLAVEVGFERLAEVQEEILWMCEAAHVPVVWATQVLEQLTRDGSPSRAEVSDAALGERAECVMLNKGPYQVDAVRALHDILTRMHRHQEKKRPLLAHLCVADRFFELATARGGAAGASPASRGSPDPAVTERAGRGRRPAERDGSLPLSPPAAAGRRAGRSARGSSSPAA